MKIKVCLPLLSVVILAVTNLGFSQNQTTVRWEEAAANSTRFMRDGVVVKQLVTDGANGITVTASIKDSPDNFYQVNPINPTFNLQCQGYRSQFFYVELELKNHNQSVQEIRPEDMKLLVIRPGSKDILFIPAGTVAKKVTNSANQCASAIETNGLLATKTEIKHVPVTETNLNPASINDPTQPATITTTRIDVVTETVPDPHTRGMAQIEGRRIRSKGQVAANRILGTALKSATLAANSSISGAIYYDREKDVEEVLLRIPLGSVSVEIPFKAVKRWSLGPGTIKFE